MDNNTTSRKRASDETCSDVEPKRLRCSMNAGPSLEPQCITVEVGEHGEAFLVDKHILLTSSRWLKDMIDEVSNDSDVPTRLHLHSITSRAFKIYVKWLYSGLFYIAENEGLEKPSQCDRTSTTFVDEYSKWSECYYLGDVLEDTDFTDACIDLVQEMMISDDRYFLELAETIYLGLFPPARHRKFAVDVAIQMWNDERFQSIFEDNHPREFLCDLIKYMGPKMKQVELFDTDDTQSLTRTSCKYHEHVRLGRPCYKKTRRSHY